MLNFPTTPKQPGLCSCCDTPVFDIVKKWPEGHPLEGEVRVTGPVHDDAIVIGMVTLQGSIMEATFCSECADQFSHQDVPSLWDRICHTCERELSDLYRLAIGSNPLSPESVLEAKQFYSLSVPIGILYKAPWRMKL